MKKANRRATPRLPLTAIGDLDPVRGGARIVVLETGDPRPPQDDPDARAIVIDY